MNNLDDIITYLRSMGQTDMADRLRNWQSRYTRLKGMNDGLLASIDKPITLNVYVDGKEAKIEQDGK